MSKEIIGYPEITFQDGFCRGFTVTAQLTRRNKKIWGQIMGMPKYKITEWAFPRKKKRGSMRRSRHEDCSRNKARNKVLDKNYQNCVTR